MSQIVIRIAIIIVFLYTFLGPSPQSNHQESFPSQSQKLFHY